MLRLELSWGCDNTILLLKDFLHHQTKLNHTYQTKPNKTKPGLFAPIFMFRCIAIATPNSSVDLSFAIPMTPGPRFRVPRRSHSLFSHSHSLFLRSHSLYCAATAYPVCKPIFVSNPTELGKVMLRLELSCGCDNN